MGIATNQTIQESDRYYANIAEMAPVGIFHTDIMGNCLYVNQRWCEISGLSLKQSLGQGWRVAIHPDDLKLIEAQAQHFLLNRESLKTEFRLQNHQGKITWVLSEAVVENDDDGRVVGYIGTIVDISQRKQTEITVEERAKELIRVNTILVQTTTLLQQRNQELDQFAYVASHDLKAPLRAIASLSEWLEEDLADKLPKENQHQMQLLRGRVRRMEGLINGLLEYSRIGRVHTELTSVNVDSLLKEVIDSLQPPATFQIEIQPEMPTFFTKKVPLQQVFANLIDNAIQHHSRTDGRVKISVRDLGKYYEFSVADDGPGIPLEYQDKVFVIFQTLEPRDRKENTGIGLAIVKKIVETEGGFITLKPVSGPGSTFCFTWPKRSPE
ncbi:ATP-binding protein [Anabaena subtropica]|uniref:histidine kinase n=1 Tax=Anabaena subtropica FACHB-260 TaxID=2692884 RepID=A0ABR8CW43_9NOST|nr:ATP-binding protein [Anabaena subtropica]MBD2347153.1 PAS domain S-box protein [Anabaena subtropica FACHB-260]